MIQVKTTAVITVAPTTGKPSTVMTDLHDHTTNSIASLSVPSTTSNRTVEHTITAATFESSSISHDHSEQGKSVTTNVPCIKKLSVNHSRTTSALWTTHCNVISDCSNSTSSYTNPCGFSTILAQKESKKTNGRI